MALPGHWSKAHPDLPWPGMPEPERAPDGGELPPVKSPLEADLNSFARAHSSAQPTPRAQQPRSAEFGAIATIEPRAFKLSSSLLWQMMTITVNEWGWPAEIMQDPGKWLDIYLHRSARDYGWLLGGYVRINEDGEAISPKGPDFTPPDDQDMMAEDEDDSAFGQIAGMEDEEGAEEAQEENAYANA